MEKFIYQCRGCLADFARMLGISRYDAATVLRKTGMYLLFCKVRDTRIATNRYTTYADAAVELGVHPKTVSRRVKQYGFGS